MIITYHEMALENVYLCRKTKLLKRKMMLQIVATGVLAIHEARSCYPKDVIKVKGVITGGRDLEYIFTVVRQHPVNIIYINWVHSNSCHLKLSTGSLKLHVTQQKPKKFIGMYSVCFIWFSICLSWQSLWSERLFKNVCLRKPSEVDHYRVVFCLSVRTSRRAKPFLWKNLARGLVLIQRQMITP